VKTVNLEFCFCEEMKKWGKMKRLIISVLLILLIAAAMISCSSSRKSRSELKGLMLLDNKQLGRNRAYYSKHNVKIRRDAFRKYAKNGRDR
jgi:hypothetical protein